MPAPKICVLSTVHTSQDIRVYYKETRTLVRAGYAVTLIIQNDRDEVRDGIKIVALPKATNRFQRMVLSSLTVFQRALREQADIYHFHDPELIPAGILLKVLTRKRVIYDVHEDLAKDIMSKDWIPRPLRKPISWATRIMERLGSRFFDAIVAATDDIANNFKNHIRSVAIRNFPALNFPDLPPRKDDERFTMIYVGLLSPERGITEIVRALEYLEAPESVRLILCGEFSPPSYEKSLRSLAVSDRVEFVGWVNPMEARQKMGQVDVGLVCYHPEENHMKAMPNKLFEYMIAGVAVLSSDFPLWKEIVEGNRCGMTVNPLNPRDIAAALSYLRSNPGLRLEMGINGKKSVLEKYNWDNEAKKLLNLYQDLLIEKRV